MKEPNYTILFFFLLFQCCFFPKVYTQSKIAFNLNVGSIIGISKFEPIDGYTPYFNADVLPDLGYDIGLSYYLNPKTAIEAKVAYYIHNAGLKIRTFDGGNGSGNNRAFRANHDWMPTLMIRRALKGEEPDKFRLWFIGGVGMEPILDRGKPPEGFPHLINYDYAVKDAWYPRLMLGISMDWRLRNSNLGLRLQGGLGFYYHDYYFYRGISNGQFYEAVLKHKGDYIGLLVTYERAWPSRFKKENDKKKKKKKKKKSKKKRTKRR